MKKRKILITATTFPRFKGDKEPRFILDLAKSLLPYADVTVIVPSSPGTKDTEIMEGVKVERFHYFPIRKMETLTAPGAILSRIKENKLRLLLVPFFLMGFFRKLKEKKGKFDMVQANWIFPQGILQMLVGDSKTPFVITCHGSDINTIKNPLMLYLKKKALKRAWGITCVSENLMETVNGIYRNKNQAIISMGVDNSAFGKKYYKENYFGQKGKKVILFVGRLVEFKGARYLIEAMRYVKNAKLVIVGKGEEERNLKLKAVGIKKDLLKNSSEIYFAGAKNHRELKEMYASADLFVLPGIEASDGSKEGLGLVMLEALASELPVVASRVGGIPSVIKDGENGFLVKQKNPYELGKKINMVLEDDGIRNRLRSASKETALKYDYSVIGKKYAKFMRLN